MSLKIVKEERDPRADQRDLLEMQSIRRGLLEMTRTIEYPRWTCPCQSTPVTRKHEQLARGIASALAATEKLIIHYLDRGTVI